MDQPSLPPTGLPSGAAYLPLGERAAHGPRWLVICAGLFTTALALLAVYILDFFFDFYAMGFYAEYVLPVGPLLVGVTASIGYGLASWLSGVRITRGLLWTMLGLQVGAYFLAQYIPYLLLEPVSISTGEPLSFWRYFDLVTRNWAWESDSGGVGEALGMWGYGLRALELTGFVGGSLIIPGALLAAPYCQGCARYMKKRELGLLPASIAPAKIKKNDTQAKMEYEEAVRKSDEQTQGLLRQLEQDAAAGRGEAIAQLVAGHQPAKKQIAALPVRLKLELIYCPGCAMGQLRVSQVRGKGDTESSTKLWEKPLETRAVCQVQPGLAAVLPGYQGQLPGGPVQPSAKPIR